MMSRGDFSWRSRSSATVFSKNELCMPVEPTEPISSLSHIRMEAVTSGTDLDASTSAFSAAKEQTRSSWP